MAQQNQKVYENAWEDGINSASFGGENAMLRSFPELTKSALNKEILPRIYTYQLHRPARRPTTFNPYFVRTIRKNIQADIVFMRNPASMIEDNNGYQYILIVQDTFSRKIWTAALKAKNANAVFPRLRAIFALMQPFHKDAVLVIDRGTEFLNRQIQELAESHHIKIIHPSTGHAAHVERANLSLQRLIYANITKQADGKKWHLFLPNAVNIMNNKHHRMSPNEAELTENRNKVNEAMSLYRHKAFIKELNKSHKKKKPKYEINDQVRIQKHKDRNTRGYTRPFRTEIFKISRVLDHLPITMYTISDFNGQVIKGNFYQTELSLVKGDMYM